MIHDILLSLISSDVESLPISEFAISELSSNFIHPGEAKILEDIIKVAGQYKDIRKFIIKYNGTSATGVADTVNGSVEEPLSKGLYLQAFCDGMDAALEKFRTLIIELEKRYLKTPSHSLLFIYHQIDRYQPLLCFLLKLISGIRSQRLHGCMILDYLQKNSLHGNNNICDAVQIIQRAIYVVFIKQLYQWLIYGRAVDPCGEFFIQQVGDSTTTAGHQSASSAASETTSINTELWRYEVAYTMLPYYFPPSWAENVLLTGQTVLTFNSSPKDLTKKLDFVDDATDRPHPHTLWGDQEYEIFRKFHELQSEEVVNVSKLEQIVNVIKACVTEHLFNIAMRDADLIMQMRLIKDFYLLGRGELYHEFIKLMRPSMTKGLYEGSQRDLNRAFNAAGNAVNISEDIEQFSFYVPKEMLENYEHTQKAFINSLTLKYKVKWPLHLLFSPKILERYNEMFRFLLKIKKTQFDLQEVWSQHRHKKVQRQSEILQFRNKLAFLIDNLQYYLQVDVLESQFSILMAAIQEAKDFEQIQKAHSIFQSNVLSLCFLIPQAQTLLIPVSSSKDESNVFIENPVLVILNKILECTYMFCKLCGNDEIPAAQRLEIRVHEETFDGLMDALLKLLVGMRVGPLSQLILRLDYNYWFSSKNKNIKE